MITLELVALMVGVAGLVVAIAIPVAGLIFKSSVKQIARENSERVIKHVDANNTAVETLSDKVNTELTISEIERRKADSWESVCRTYMQESHTQHEKISSTLERVTDAIEKSATIQQSMLERLIRLENQ